MRILALLPADARGRLDRAVDAGQLVDWADDAAAAADMMHEERYHALVFDPGVVEADDFELVMRAVKELAVPMMLYTRLDPAAAQRIVAAVAGAAHELVLRGAEDTPELLRQRIAALVRPSASAILLSRAAPRFREFPGRLQAAAVGLFGNGPLPRWVGGLVQQSGFARRTVDRWMNRGGISGAARLLDAARLARVWEPLVEDAREPAEVAADCGYARRRLLTAHVRRFLGMSPPELHSRFTRESFSARLADALLD